MLSERLQALIHAGAVARREGRSGPEYELTEAGRELAGLVIVLGTWGQRWLPRQAHAEDLDVDPLLVDMQRRVRAEALPPEPMVVRFEIGRSAPRFLLLKAGDVALCTQNLGFPEPLIVRGPVAALVAWWRGDASFVEAQRMGVRLEGPRALTRAFPDWFERYQLAHIEPVRRSA